MTTIDASRWAQAEPSGRKPWSSRTALRIDADGRVRPLYEPQPQQWEYVVKYPHEEADHTNCHGLTEWANDLGDDGWELVAIAEGGKWVFKRPKRGDAQMAGIEFDVAAATPPEGLDTVEISKELAGEIFSSIMVWEFKSAPERFRQLSPHGGDEDWVAFIPDSFGNCEPLWMEEGTAFGGSDVSEHEVSGGRVYIGAHA